LNADKQPDVWIVDDDSSIRWVLEKALQEDGIQTRSFDRADALLEAFAAQQPDVLITDIRMPGMDGIEMMRHLGLEESGLPVIVMTAHADLDSAVAAFKNGAFEYLPKPFDIDLAVSLVRRACQSNEPEAPREQTTIATISSMIGQAPAMQDVFRTIGRLSRSSMNVLITGESGTGKELVARALHEHSPRANRPFIALNTTAIAKDLLESELFGHERGAFTGANARATGRFEQAEGGTLFLDEIGDMPMEAQTRLLRVLQQGEYTTVGGRTPIKTDVRIVAASNKDLRILIQQGLFREDLFFRLNVVPLRLPPLRERIEDLPDLIRHFFALAEKDGLPPKKLDAQALERLKQHRWPGNVRELENLARRLAALYSVIEGELAPPAVVSGGSMPQSVDNLGGAVEMYLASHFAGFPNGLPPPGLYHRILKEIEVPLLTAALAANRGNQIKAADLLGLNRNTLRKKIRDLDIQVYRSGG